MQLTDPKRMQQYINHFDDEMSHVWLGLVLLSMLIIVLYGIVFYLQK